jgi:hypothetical protein
VRLFFCALYLFPKRDIKSALLGLVRRGRPAYPAMATLDKQSAMATVVAARRLARHPIHRALSKISNGRYDCEFVSPWTKSACNLDADLMIIGQDWVSESFLLKHSDVLRQLGYDPKLATNKNLQRLLLDQFGLSFSEIYATNVFIYVKAGGMSAPLPMRDLTDCARRFLLPQIEIVKPRMAICLGQRTFNSVRRALGLSALSLNEAAQPTGNTKYLETEIYGSPHLGARGTANAGGIKWIIPQWTALAERLSGMTRKKCDQPCPLQKGPSSQPDIDLIRS